MKADGKVKRPSAFHRLVRIAGEYLYPPRCVRCRSTELCGISLSQAVLLDDPDSEKRGCFCPLCMADFAESVREKCEVCGMPASLCECSTEALSAVGVDKVYSTFVYDKNDHKNSASALIYKIKRTDNKDAINFAAHIIAERLQKATFGDISDTIITYAPRTNLAIRQNGGDHMKLIAKLTAKITGIVFLEAFYNTSHKEQKKKNAEDRFLSAQRSIKLKMRAKRSLHGKKVIIIDDIVTSGATLAACAALLLQTDAESVKVITLAKAKKHMTENGVAKAL